MQLVFISSWFLGSENVKSETIKRFFFFFFGCYCLNNVLPKSNMLKSSVNHNVTLFGDWPSETVWAAIIKIP